MSGQIFAARERFEFPNGAIGWRPGGPMDCLGPFAKIQNCPIHDTEDRRTVYATGYADTYFSLPGRCTYKGKTARGSIVSDNDGAVSFWIHEPPKEDDNGA